MLLGALIGQKIYSPALAIILALLSHYFLDLIPHIEYPIENIVKKQWKKAAPDIFRVLLDFTLGILIIFSFSRNQPIIYICALFAILPDGLSILSLIVKTRVLEKHNKLHQEKIHFLKYKKISIFWRVLSQVILVIVLITLFKI